MVRVLLVEDDPVIARVISFYLQKETSYEVTHVQTAGEALACARKGFDVVLLDVMLPDVNGIDLCGELRRWLDCPMLFVSCLDSSDTIVNALEAGGDDFIVKPFDNKVLVARIEANLRRHRDAAKRDTRGQVACKGFVLDTSRNVVVRGGEEVRLSPQEARVLLYFMEHPRRYLSAEEIYRDVWGEDSLGDTRSVAVHIHNIRRKIEPAEGYRFIRNVWGRGYVFDPEGAAGEGFPEGGAGDGKNS